MHGLNEYKKSPQLGPNDGRCSRRSRCVNTINTHNTMARSQYEFTQKDMFPHNQSAHYSEPYASGISGNKYNRRKPGTADPRFRRQSRTRAAGGDKGHVETGNVQNALKTEFSPTATINDRENDQHANTITVEEKQALLDISSNLIRRPKAVKHIGRTKSVDDASTKFNQLSLWNNSFTDLQSSPSLSSRDVSPTTKRSSTCNMSICRDLYLNDNVPVSEQKHPRVDNVLVRSKSVHTSVSTSSIWGLNTQLSLSSMNDWYECFDGRVKKNISEDESNAGGTTEDDEIQDEGFGAKLYRHANMKQLFLQIKLLLHLYSVLVVEKFKQQLYTKPMFMALTVVILIFMVKEHWIAISQTFGGKQRYRQTDRSSAALLAMWIKRISTFIFNFLFESRRVVTDS